LAIGVIFLVIAVKWSVPFVFVIALGAIAVDCTRKYALGNDQAESWRLKAVWPDFHGQAAAPQGSSSSCSHRRDR
jgi:hypothetical protein